MGVLNFRSSSVRGKLLSLAGLGIFLMLVLAGANQFAVYKINQALKEIDQADAESRAAALSIAKANAMMQKINMVIKNVSQLRSL